MTQFVTGSCTSSEFPRCDISRIVWKHLCRRHVEGLEQLLAQVSSCAAIIATHSLDRLLSVSEQSSFDARIRANHLDVPTEISLGRRHLRQL